MNRNRKSQRVSSKAAGHSDAAESADAETRETLTALVAPWQPIPRAGLSNDVAHAALYLASDAASFVNGHDLVIDGGLSAGRTWSTARADREALDASSRSPAR